MLLLEKVTVKLKKMIMNTLIQNFFSVLLKAFNLDRGNRVTCVT